MIHAFMSRSIKFSPVQALNAATCRAHRIIYDHTSCQLSLVCVFLNKPLNI
jgi:hypothetical protein